MEQVSMTESANDLSFELARWYHDLARICLQAAEQHLHLTENSPQEDLEKAMVMNDVIRIRMATVQSVESTFREEFQRHYIDHQVEQILAR